MTSHHQTDLNIRLLTIHDMRSFRALRLIGLQEAPWSFAASYEEEAAQPEETVAAMFLNKLSHTNIILGAFLGEQLLGIVGLYQYEPSKRAHRARLWGVYVLSEHRRRGVARRLLTEAVAYAKQLATVEILELTVESNNTAAQALYHSIGFNSWGVERQALKIATDYFDEDHMWMKMR